MFFSLIKSVLVVKFIGNPVENITEKVQKAFFRFFSKLKLLFFTPYPENLKMQNIKLVLLVQEYALMQSKPIPTEV
jgi:hypothetical protein